MTHHQYPSRPRVVVPRDRGAASIYTAAIGLVMVLAGLGIALQAARLVATAQARTAADLGALAGAMRAPRGQTAACDRATEIATRNGATALSCSLNGLDLTLTVELRGIESTSRAGPVRSSPTGANDD